VLSGLFFSSSDADGTRTRNHRIDSCTVNSRTVELFFGISSVQCDCTGLDRTLQVIAQSIGCCSILVTLSSRKSVSTVLRLDADAQVNNTAPNRAGDALARCDGTV
jgi:hypothetical protein